MNRISIHGGSTPRCQTCDSPTRLQAFICQNFGKIFSFGAPHQWCFRQFFGASILFPLLFCHPLAHFPSHPSSFPVLPFTAISHPLLTFPSPCFSSRFPSLSSLSFLPFPDPYLPFPILLLPFPYLSFSSTFPSVGRAYTHAASIAAA